MSECNGRRWLVWLSLLWMWGGTSLMAQNKLPTLDASYDGLKWENFVSKVEQAYELQFFYQPDSLAGLLIEVPAGGAPLLDVLQKNLKQRGYAASFRPPSQFLITQGEPLVFELPESFWQVAPPLSSPPEPADEMDFVETQTEVAPPTQTVGVRNGNGTATLSGQLTQTTDGSPVIGATVLIKELEMGAISNSQGLYTLKLPPGTYTFLVRSLNFKELSLSLDLQGSGRLDLDLQGKMLELDGVELTARADNPVAKTQMGIERVSIAQIREMPAVLGERDIIKVAQLLPGIQSVGEGSAGFYVRGSPADQNMFYFNEVPIYNTSHLFGFFSAFPSDAVSEFSVSKSHIPARFGGRLASIFDVTARPGNQQRFSVSGGVSPITARVLAEGPIQRGKSSFLVAARSTYSNWILQQINNLDFQNTRARFADGLAHLAFELGENDRLNLFGYYSFDDISFAGHTDLGYENLGGSAAWTHFFQQKHSLKTSLVYSRYELRTASTESPLQGYQQTNALEHSEFRTRLLLQPNAQHEISMGINTILYGIDRGSFEPFGGASLQQAQLLGQEQAVESGIFIGDEWEISPRLAANIGLRYNWYRYFGPQSVYLYEEGQPKEPGTIVDSLNFGNWDNIQTYSGLDYRASLRFMLTENASLKASVNQLHQYIFLLSNTIALAPSDKWKLTDYHLEPMVGRQYSLGWYGSALQKRLNLSVEGYYKRVENLVEFKDGAELLINAQPEQDVLQGDLRAYGIELMVKKPFGRLNGWVSYTFARSIVQVDGATPDEQTNFGEAYPANWDKPHALNLVSNYKFSRRLSLSGNLVYSTGRPATYPTSLYSQNSAQVIAFSTRNAYRIPDYWRVDLSLKIEGNLKAEKLIHGSWNISLYNLMGRNNAYSVFFKPSNVGVSGYRVSIFANPIFSVAYDFKLGNYAN